MSRSGQRTRRTVGATLCTLALVAASGPPATGAELYRAKPTPVATSFYGIPQGSAALRFGMDWTSELLWVEVLLVAFSSGLVFGMRGGWPRRPSRVAVPRSGSNARAEAVVASGLAPEPAPAAPGRTPPAPVRVPLKPPIELAMPAQASAPVRAVPRPPVGAPAMPDPERHMELYAEEYKRQMRRLNRLRREKGAQLGLAAPARPQREYSDRLDDPPAEAPEEAPGE